MPTYTLTGKNGKTYAIEGVEGLSQEEVEAEILRRDPSAGLTEAETRREEAFTDPVKLARAAGAEVAENPGNVAGFATQTGKQAAEAGLNALDFLSQAGMETAKLHPMGRIGAEVISAVVPEKVKPFLLKPSRERLKESGVDLSTPDSPTGSPEWIWKQVVQGLVGNSILPGGASVGAKVGNVVGPTAGQTAGGWIGDIIAGKYGKTAGEIAGSILPAMIRGRMTNKERAAKTLMNEYSPEQLRSAGAERGRVESVLGAPVSLAQLLEKRLGPNAISNEVDALVSSSAAGPYRKNLREQLPAAQGLGARMLADMGDKPLDSITGEGIVNAWRGAMDSAKAARTDATHDLYEAAKRVEYPPGVNIGDLIASAQRRAAEKKFLTPESAEGGTIRGSAAKFAAENARRKGTPDTMRELPILDARGNPIMETVPGIPATPEHAGAYMQLARESTSAAQNARKNPEMSQNSQDIAAGHEAAGHTAKKILRDTNPTYAAAEDLYQELSDPVRRLEASPLGKINPATKASNTPKDFEKLLDAHPNDLRAINHVLVNPLDGSPGDPTVLGTIMRSKYSREYEKHLMPVGSAVPGEGPGMFVTKIAGTPAEREKFLTAVELNADNLRPGSGADAREAADRVLNAFQTVSKGRRGLGQVDPSEFAEKAGANKVTLLSRWLGFIGGTNPMAEALERRFALKTNRQFLDLMFSPNGPEELIKIAGTKSGERAAMAIVSNALGVAATD